MLQFTQWLPTWYILTNLVCIHLQARNLCIGIILLRGLHVLQFVALSNFEIVFKL